MSDESVPIQTTLVSVQPTRLTSFIAVTILAATCGEQGQHAKTSPHPLNPLTHLNNS